jgi:hypothetical protein
MITGGEFCLNPASDSAQEQSAFKHDQSSRRFVKVTRSGEEEMAASSSRTSLSRGAP